MYKNKHNNILSRIKAANASMIAILIVCLGHVTSLHSQVNCNIPISCNNQVQISLGTNCTEVITGNMILQNALYPANNYTVVTRNKAGVILPNNLLTNASIGQEYTVSVSLNGCNISCWGNITVEDKLPPVFSACPNDTVSCGESTAPGNIIRPTAVDACSPASTVLTFVDKEKVSQCTETFVKVITRTWTAKDRIGNESKCVQVINVIRPTISDIIFPKNYDDVDNPVFSCDQVLELLPNGAPSPNVTGKPGGADCANIMVYYNDVIFDICGASKKILRQWNVIDWCTGKDSSSAQIIKIVDRDAPVCVSAEDFKFNTKTDEGKCTGTFKVPAPTVVYECSDWTYTVAYKLRDSNGRPFVNPITTNVVKTTNTDGSYFYSINSLPSDTSWIIYNITDACGNTSNCFTEVIIEDKEAPTAICEGYNVVSLDDDGLGNVYATSINSGSIDNCGVSKFEVKRVENKCGRSQDLNFSERVTFCCADVSTNPNVYQKVILRVYDHSGNFSECTSNVKVQDKKGPKISDVPDKTINCGVNFRNTAITGRPVFSDNCNVKLDSAYTTNLRCELGTVSVVWTATDNQGNKATSLQIITIADDTPFGLNNITWPENIEVNGCGEGDILPDVINSRPKFIDVECADIATSYSDDYYDVDDACKKVLRTWRVINWCTANTQNPQYITYVQKIVLKNSEGPKFASGCESRVINTNSSDCKDFFEHLVTATDDCTKASEIKYSWAYNENSDSTINERGNGNRYGRLYPVGTHTMTFTATDLCDNKTNCTYTFKINDTKAPTPICHASLVTVLDQSGKAEIWANDFDSKSIDLCSGTNLKFSFDSLSTGARGRTFTCANIKNGVAESIPLRVYVFDQSNNREYCDVILQLQDSQNKNVCPNIGNLTANIYGRVQNKSSVGFTQLSVQLTDEDNQNEMKSLTSADGEFSIKEVPFFKNYTLSPSKNDDILNGVSTLDLVFMQRHILGIKSIADPYDLIAADVNNDKKISAGDLVALRKVILGVENKFNNNTAWKFLQASHKFADPKSPYDYPTHLTLSQVNGDVAKNDFIAIKVGDVDNSARIANLANNTAETRNNETKISVRNSTNTEGKTDVVFIASEDTKINGLQLSVTIENLGGKFSGIKSNKLNITSQDFATSNDGVKVAYASTNTIDVKAGDVLFTLMLDSRNGESISLKKGKLNNEIYDNNYEVKQIELIFDRTSEKAITATSSAPNPFSQSTTISFTSQLDMIVPIKILDITGRTIYELNHAASQGKNQVQINKQDLNNQPGIYFYKFTVEGELQTGAIILSE
jgi:hypothetical protein